MSNPRKRQKLDTSRKSIVWQFYDYPDDPDDRQVKCPLCKTSICYLGSTTGLAYHLKNVHKEKYNELMNKKQHPSHSPSPSSENAEKALGRAFATGAIPYRFAENSEFRRFLLLKPDNFKVPSASKMRRIVQNIGSEHIQKLRERFEGLEKYSLLTDGYSELRKGINFYSCHIAYVTSDFQRKIDFCGIRTCDGNDTTSISETLCAFLKEFKLKFTDCSAVTSDAASTLVKLAEIHEIDQVLCGCHQLDLIIGEFTQLKEIRNVQKRIENFATQISRKKQERNNLQAMSRSMGIVGPLPLPIPSTRWAGLPILIDQYLQHYPSAKNLTQLQKFLMKPQELKKIELIRDALKPIHAGILRLERDTSFASEIIPTMIFILSSVSKKKTTVFEKLKGLVTKRLEKALENDRLLVTMLVDHRYSYIDKWISPKKWQDVEKMIDSYNRIDNPTPGNSSPVSDESNDGDDDIDEYLQSSVTHTTQHDGTIQAELLKYRALLQTNRPNFDNPLDFWKANHKNYPILAAISIELLSTPASSATCERTFSRCTDVLRQTKRNRLKVESLNDLLTANELSKLEALDPSETSTTISEDSDSETSSDIEELDDDEINDMFSLDDETSMFPVEDGGEEEDTEDLLK